MKTPKIDLETPLIPEVIADTVTQDKELAVLLCERARWHYAFNGSFRRKCKGASGREHLKAFMSHWATAGIERMRTWWEAKSVA